MDPRVQEIVLKEEISTGAVVHFECSRGAVQRLRCIVTKDSTQVLSRCYEAKRYWATEKVFEVSKTTADLEEIFKNCDSTKAEEQLDVISKVSEGSVSWETAEVSPIPRSTKRTGHLICKPNALERKASAIRKEIDDEQASLVVSSEESTTVLNEFKAFDLKNKLQVLGRAHMDTHMEATLTDNFHSYDEIVETIGQVHLGEGGSRGPATVEFQKKTTIGEFNPSKR